MSFLQSIALAGLLGCCSGSRADAPAVTHGKTGLLPVRTTVQVKEVTGQVEYAYDSTGWRALESGKTLRAGAVIRAGAGSAAVLRVAQTTSFYKVSPETKVQITQETPVEELAPPALAEAKTKETIAAR